jgi:CRP-like cAMP-binding protein
MSLLQHIKSLIEVSDALEMQFSNMIQLQQHKKGTTLISPVQTCNYLYFVKTGVIRGYYNCDEKEITNWIAKENEFGTCFYSFLKSIKSTEYIKCIEDCELEMISFNDLQKLYNKFPVTEKLGRVILEDYYLKLEERLLSIQFKEAKERYLHFMTNKADLLNRVPLGYIASYLGISQETLSRMRAT